MNHTYTFTFHLSSPKARWMPLSFLIRLFQGTEYSHCCVEYEQSGHKMIYDSKNAQNNVQNSKYFWEINYPVKSFKLHATEEESQVIKRSFYERAGIPYGYLQILGNAFQVIVYRLFKKRVKNPFHNGEKKSVCSEEIGRILVEDLRCEVLDLPGYDSIDLIWVEEKLSNNERFVRVR